MAAMERCKVATVRRDVALEQRKALARPAAATAAAVVALSSAAAVGVAVWPLWIVGGNIEELRPHVPPGGSVLINSRCGGGGQSWAHGLRAGDHGATALSSTAPQAPLPTCGADGVDPVPGTEPLAGLATRGFAVLRRFLSDGEVQAVRAIYHSKEWRDNANYPTKMVDETEVSPNLREKLAGVIERIRAATDLQADTPLPRSLFFTINGSDEGHTVRIPWHQDTESFLLAESHYHYVNLYMAIEKSTADDGNLYLVPFDILRECSPELYALTLGKGATDFFDCEGLTSAECQNSFGEGQNMSAQGASMLPAGAKMLRLDNNHAAVHALAFHLDSLACSMDLLPGDLLAFRGDVIHRTGPFVAPRVAWSVRHVFSEDKVSIDRLLNGGIHKLVTINGNIGSYATRMGYIHAAGLREMSFAELRATKACVNVHGGKCPLSSWQHKMSHVWAWWYTALFRLRQFSYEFMTGMKMDAQLGKR